MTQVNPMYYLSGIRFPLPSQPIYDMILMRYPNTTPRIRYMHIPLCVTPCTFHTPTLSAWHPYPLSPWPMRCSARYGAPPHCPDCPWHRCYGVGPGNIAPLDVTYVIGFKQSLVPQFGHIFLQEYPHMQTTKGNSNHDRSTETICSI